MQIKLLVGLASASMSLSPGDTHECDADEALRMIDAGFAEPQCAESQATLTARDEAIAAEARAQAEAEAAAAEAEAQAMRDAEAAAAAEAKAMTVPDATTPTEKAVKAPPAETR